VSTLTPFGRVFLLKGVNSITLGVCVSNDIKPSRDSSFIVILLPNKQARGPPRAHEKSFRL